MKRHFAILILISVFMISCKTDKEKSNEKLREKVTVIPISHGSLILQHKDLVVYVDPVGGAALFEGQEAPEIILITDIHGDHLNVTTLEAIVKTDTKIVAPQAVYEKISDLLKAMVSPLENFETKEFVIGSTKMNVEAIPMYNLREEAMEFHTKGRGNGYVLSLANERVYISGDTEDIPEMRSLQNIDKAFVCMNLPWTMPVENAASAVLEFKPKEVYPYHYRGTDGLSDISKFETLINEKSKEITVHLLNWYPNR